ncbi:MAG TPA: DUF3492 domain-containing protein [Thiolapillus brandeum]|uniref:DUF3492 domain-containing protein n=1 Tax=Thiolapillus brandeum TaxID=1076588 RepID=A0A7C5MU25_9GAMM|nr:DUF3492 domain-containing protein [Thiolapillus brandeum]
MNEWNRVIDSGRPADIALLLEGTYPYVSGGVSSWVHQIINGFPMFSFSLVFLGGSPKHYGEIKYPLPANVRHLERHYLMESWQETAIQPRRGKAAVFSHIRELHEGLRRRHQELPQEVIDGALRALGRKGQLSREDFLFSEEAWSMITDHYERFCTDPSFVDYFWTVRTMHAPMFLLSEIADGMPQARMVHSVSTGYAGLLGVLAHRRRGLPFLLTEHGIYTKERKIDLAQADWISDAREAFGGSLDDDVSYIRRLWIRFFEGIGRLAYDAAEVIVSLYEGNRQRQIADGADPQRCRIIPNGIDLERFLPVRQTRPSTPRPILGLIGRVVPIKDIKTFIRAMRGVCNAIPEAEGWIIGPEDEDPEYAQECRNLVASLGLENRVRFLGFRRVEEVLSEIGLLVLTSISEALPLVILEGFAAGVPALATDVGACRDLIEGGIPEDRAIGRAGAVVSIANPEETAAAAIALLGDVERWQAARAAGMERVERYYTQPQMYQHYLELYRHCMLSGATGERGTG